MWLYVSLIIPQYVWFHVMLKMVTSGDQTALPSSSSELWALSSTSEGCVVSCLVCACACVLSDSKWGVRSTPLNSHPSWLVTRLSAALPLPSIVVLTSDLEALYLNHITCCCVLYLPFEVTGVRHLSSPVWVNSLLTHDILISWFGFSYCVCGCVCVSACVHILCV